MVDEIIQLGSFSAIQIQYCTCIQEYKSRPPFSISLRTKDKISIAGCPPAAMETSIPTKTAAAGKEEEEEEDSREAFSISSPAADPSFDIA